MQYDTIGRMVTVFIYFSAVFHYSSGYTFIPDFIPSANLKMKHLV